MDTMLHELIAFLQGASPTVWATLMKQVYADAAEGVLLGVVFLIAIPMSYKAYKHGEKMKKDDRFSDWEIPFGIGISCMPVSFLLALSLLITALKSFYNPEYYAIQLILSQLGQ